MSKPVETYSRRGFVQTLLLAVVVSAASGLLAFYSASERVTCARTPSRTLDCTFARTLLGRVPVRSATAADIGAVSILTARESVSAGDVRRSSDVLETYRLRVVAASGELRSVQSSYSELDDLRRALDAMLVDPSQQRFATVIEGTSPATHRWSVGFLVFGASLVPLWVLGYFFPVLRPKVPPTR